MQGDAYVDGTNLRLAIVQLPPNGPNCCIVSIVRLDTVKGMRTGHVGEQPVLIAKHRRRTDERRVGEDVPDPVLALGLGRVEHGRRVEVGVQV